MVKDCGLMIMGLEVPFNRFHMFMICEILSCYHNVFHLLIMSVQNCYNNDIYVSQMEADPFGGSSDEGEQRPHSQSVEQENKSVRGRTWMSRNTKKRSEGHLTPVEYNEYGQLVGGSRSNVSSQLGSVVRATVSININSWKDVSVVDKNKIWDTMKVYFY